VSQHVGQLRHRLIAYEDIADSEIQRKVELGINSRIQAVPLPPAALKESALRRVTVKGFADDVHLRILALDRRHPVAPEIARHVWQRVLAYRIKPSDARPPQRVLYQVAARFRIVLVEVGKDVDEPSVEHGPCDARR